MLYIVTAVHNRYKSTFEFVTQLLEQTYSDYCLLLVDDGSTDNTDSMVKERVNNSIILYGDGNLWWGGALHKAYKYLTKNVVKDDDYILLCNDDITFSNDFLQKGINYVDKYPDKIISSIGKDIKTEIFVESAEYRDPITAHGKFLTNGEDGNCAPTRALFMNGKAYRKIGGMHPILLPHYCSDIEYTIRAHRKGYPSISFEDLVVYVHLDLSGDAKCKNLKQLMSKRYMNNPIYKLNFILMVTPVHLLPAYIWNLLFRKKK